MAKSEEKRNYKTYKYVIYLTYNYKGKDVKIQYQQLPQFVITRDYINHNRPVGYATIQVDKRMLHDMVDNMNKKKMKVSMYKISLDIKEEKVDTEVLKKKPKIKVFEDEFTYVVPSRNINNNEEVEYGGENKDNKDMYTSVIVGLVHPRTIKDNQSNLPHTYYKNTRVTDAILHRCENVHKLVFQPVDNNVVISDVPSTNTVSDFLSLLDKKYKFYKRGYRLFFDYDHTCLIGNEGKLIKRKGEKIYSVIFKVHSPEDPKSKIRGMDTDEKNKLYFIDVDVNSIEPYESRSDDQRAEEINKNIVESYKPNKQLDIVYITKDGLDTNSFTLNKEYFIDNYKRLYNKRGRFIPIAKRDLYVIEGEFYKVSTIITLKFVKFE